MILIPQSVVYRGLLTDLRISSVDGTAFLDACAALVPYADGNHLVEIYPSGGGALGLKGFLKAQGDGEDLGEELVTNGNMETGDPPTGWSSAYGSTLSSVSDERTGGSGSKSLNVLRGVSNTSCNQQITVVSGGLYASSGWIRNVDSVGGARLVMPGIDTQYRKSTLWYNASAYHTLLSSTTSIDVPIHSSGNGRADDISVKQVLTPSTSGCLIVSTKGGTTYNFAYKNAGFVYNAASYYCVVRKVR